MTPTELRQAAEYVRDNRGYLKPIESGEAGYTPDEGFIAYAKMLADHVLADGIVDRFASYADEAEANEILRSMGFAGYRPSWGQRK